MMALELTSMFSQPKAAVLAMRPDSGELARRFTDLEKSLLQLMSEGMSKKQIAAALQLSVHTVNFHLRRVYEKLNVNTNTAAVARAIRENII